MKSSAIYIILFVLVVLVVILVVIGVAYSNMQTPSSDTCKSFVTADACKDLCSAQSPDSTSCKPFITADTCKSFVTAGTCSPFITADTCKSFVTADTCSPFVTADACKTVVTVNDFDPAYSSAYTKYAGVCRPNGDITASLASYPGGQSKSTPAECKTKCDGDPNCKAFEIMFPECDNNGICKGSCALHSDANLKGTFGFQGCEKGPDQCLCYVQKIKT